MAKSAEFAYASEIMADMARQTENLILEQLNDLVSRGLLVVERGPMSLVHSQDKDKIEVRQSCRLILKDKEYIEKLEAENKLLHEKIQAIDSALNFKIECVPTNS